MNSRYAPQRRLLLSLERDRSPGADERNGPSPAVPDANAGRETALSIPDSVRALGEPLDPFFEACGGRRTLALGLRHETDPEAEKTFLFQQPFVLIGRCSESDLPLHHSSIGFRHVYLQLLGGRWFFVNLAHLSRVSSSRHDPASGWFDPGSELKVGPYLIRHLPPEPGALAQSEPLLLRTGADFQDEVQLDLLNGRSESHLRRSRTLTGPITLIGAGSKCDLWLRDKSVSTIHASLVRTPQGVWVVDLLGRNGVWIDDRPAYWKRIHDGSELQIGRFRMRLRYAPRPALRRADSRTMSADKGRFEAGTARRAPRRGNLSEDAMLALVHQLAEMQSQFFEHSQLQMQMMTEMLAHLGRNQQAAIRRDLTRIDDIGRELKVLQSQMRRPTAGLSADVPPGSERQPVASIPLEPLIPPGTPTSVPADEPADIVRSGWGDEPPIADMQVETAEQGRVEAPSDSLDEPAPETVTEEDGSHFPEEEGTHSPAATAARGSIESGAEGALEANARLTRRMARLAQERNNRWRRVLQAFKRRPNG